MFKLCLTVILLGLTQINCENLPAFIWGNNLKATSSLLPALTRLSGDEFATLVKSQTDSETLTVVFVERKLSVENLSQCKLETETCFQNLRKIEQKTYVPAVEDPVTALQEYFSDNSQKTISLSNEGDVERFDASGNEKLLFVYFDTVQSDEDFAQHDELMSKLFNSIASKRENVIAVYTARHPSFVYSAPLIRKTRDTESAAKQEGEPTEKKQRVIVDKNFLFALSSMSIDGKDIPLDKISVNVNDSTDKFSLDVHVVESDNDILFKFQLSGGTWWIPEISFKNSFFQPHSQVSAYDGDSYGCVDLRLTNARIYIVIEDVQMLPRFDTAQPELTRFPDKYNDCVGFFSAAIWGGIFVVIILLSILSCGITMMLDIKTMDRFDDPKGKTITINAQE